MFFREGKDNANRVQNFHACMKSYAEVLVIGIKRSFVIGIKQSIQ